MPDSDTIKKYLRDALQKLKKTVDNATREYAYNLVEHILEYDKITPDINNLPLTTHGWFKRPRKQFINDYEDYELSEYQYNSLKKQNDVLEEIKSLLNQHKYPLEYKKEILRYIELISGEFRHIDIEKSIVKTTINEILYYLEEVVDRYISYINIKQLSKLKLYGHSDQNKLEFNYLQELRKISLIRKDSDISHTGLTE